MVDVVVILDGASEPLGSAPTSLEAARTPALDALAATGTLSRLRTVAPWLAAGSEAAIPALLGWTPHAPVDRGAVEAAAHGIDVAPGERAWRVDVLDAADGRADDATVARVTTELAAAAPRHRVHRLAGHRLLVAGPASLPAAIDRLAFTGRSPLPQAAAAELSPPAAMPLRVWPEGIVPPRLLDADTVVVGARGAAIGVARLMGAATVVPAGATGQPGSDLGAKVAAALDALAAGVSHIVLHVGGPDEAAHVHDRAAKVAALEHADRAVIAPLAGALRRARGTLRVCPDHGCDPVTGAHDASPVPCLDWVARAEDCQSGYPGGTQIDGPRRASRLTERAVAGLPLVELAVARAEAA